MDAVIYIRWSSAEQSKGSSLERQLQDCRAHAARHGWRVLAELVDDGISAFRGRHLEIGKLGRFISDAEAGQYPEGVILLTEKLDRLSREPAAIVFSWLLDITKLGVTVATVDGDTEWSPHSISAACVDRLGANSAECV